MIDFIVIIIIYIYIYDDFTVKIKLSVFFELSLDVIKLNGSVLDEFSKCRGGDKYMSKFKKMIAFFLSFPYFTQTPCRAGKEYNNYNRRIAGDTVSRGRLSLYSGSYNSRNRVAQRRQNNFKNMRYRKLYNNRFDISDRNRKNYSKEYIDSVLERKGVDVNEIKNKSKSEATKYLLGCGLPITFVVVVVSIYCVYNLKTGETYALGNYKVKIEKRLGVGGQGDAYLCSSVKDGQKYVLKSVKYGPRKGYNDPQASEKLACDKLKDVDCPYIARPLAHNKINGTFYVLYEFAEEYDWKFDKMSPEGKKKFFVEVVKQLLKVREIYAEKGILHGDMDSTPFDENNFFVEYDDGNPRVKVFDNGYAFEKKGSYTKDDVIKHTCPFTDIMHILYSIKCYASVLLSGDKSLKDLKNSIMTCVNKIDKSPYDFYNRKNRTKHACNLAKFTDNDADKCIKAIEEWLNNL